LHFPSVSFQYLINIVNRSFTADNIEHEIDHIFQARNIRDLFAGDNIFQKELLAR
jgi:hypothetical protein